MDAGEIIDEYPYAVAWSTRPSTREWVIHDEDDQPDNIVLDVESTIVVFRVKLMDAPKDAAAGTALRRAPAPQRSRHDLRSLRPRG